MPELNGPPPTIEMPRATPRPALVRVANAGDLSEALECPLKSSLRSWDRCRPVLPCHGYGQAPIGSDNRQLILFEEPGDRGIALIALLAGFYRRRQPFTVVEAEADNRVSDRLSHPVRHDQVSIN